MPDLKASRPSFKPELIDVLPAAIGDVALRALRGPHDQLEERALASVDLNRHRIRLLPMEACLGSIRLGSRMQSSARLNRTGTLRRVRRRVPDTIKPMPAELLTIDEAVRAFGISRSTLWRRIREGELPSVKRDGRVFCS